MSNAIVLRQPQELITFDDKKRELIRKTLTKDLNNEEFDLFISMAQARGLDPVLRQIHAVKRFADGKSNMVIQVGIDGFRLIASRTREHAGTDEPEYDFNPEHLPTKCKITVYRMVNGVRCAFVGIAYWDEFYPGDKQGFMWRKMPMNQLAKCAEAQALRKGFPGDLGGMYVPEELEREVIDVSSSRVDSDAQFGDDERTKAIKATLIKFEKLAVSELDIVKKFNLENVFAITDEQLKELNRIGSEIVNKRTTKQEMFDAEGSN